MDWFKFTVMFLYLEIIAIPALCIIWNEKVNGGDE